MRWVLSLKVAGRNVAAVWTTSLAGHAERVNHASIRKGDVLREVTSTAEILFKQSRMSVSSLGKGINLCIAGGIRKFKTVRDRAAVKA